MSNIFVRLERLQVLLLARKKNADSLFLQTAISSACVEHLDFLNSSLCPAMEQHSAAIHEYKNTSEIGHYKSLTDVSKTPNIVEDIDYNNHVRHSNILKIRSAILRFM